MKKQPDWFYMHSSLRSLYARISISSKRMRSISQQKWCLFFCWALYKESPNCSDKTRVYNAMTSCWQKSSACGVSSCSSAEPRVAGIGNKKSSDMSLLLIIFGTSLLPLLDPGSRHSSYRTYSAKYTSFFLINVFSSRR